MKYEDKNDVEKRGIDKNKKNELISFGRKKN